MQATVGFGAKAQKRSRHMQSSRGDEVVGEELSIVDAHTEDEIVDAISEDDAHVEDNVEDAPLSMLEDTTVLESPMAIANPRRLSLSQCV